MEKSQIFNDIISDSQAESTISVRISDIEKLCDTTFGTMYSAVLFGRRVVLKHISYCPGEQALAESLLRREYELLHQLSSPYIVSVWSLVTVEKIGTCLAMEYVDGMPLDQWLAGHPSFSARKRVLNELLEAIDYLHHKQIVHADIKPSNILITHNGAHVKLLDFGLSDQDAEPVHNIGGTPDWSAPEQINRSERIDCRTDIYALGLLIRRMFPHWYLSISKRCLMTNPSLRYASVAELRNAFVLRKTSVSVCLLLAVLLIFGVAMGIYYSKIVPYENTIVQPRQTVDYSGQPMVYNEPTTPRADYRHDTSTPVPAFEKRVALLEQELAGLFVDSLAHLRNLDPEQIARQIMQLNRTYRRCFAEWGDTLMSVYEPEVFDIYGEYYQRLYADLRQAASLCEWGGAENVLLADAHTGFEKKESFLSYLPASDNLAFTHDGRLRSGYFSISQTARVCFSRGNLQYNPALSRWQFAQTQYDFYGLSNQYISESYGGCVDLFGWGTGDSPVEVGSIEETWNLLLPAFAHFVDWGNNRILLGGNTSGCWRTLSADEWEYLLSYRKNASSLYCTAIVNGVSGLILLPDNWRTPRGLTYHAGMHDWVLNTLNAEQWERFERNGAVFLPAAGYRDRMDVVGVGIYGSYWSSTGDDAGNAWHMYFRASQLYPNDSFSRSIGRSVRLVRDIK